MSGPAVQPIWIRLPKAVKANGKTIAPARCPWTGLSAGKMFELAVPCPRNGHNPKVRSVSVPTGRMADDPKRKVAHVRLVHLPSLLKYLDELADDQSNTEQKEAA